MKKIKPNPYNYTTKGRIKNDLIQNIIFNEIQNQLLEITLIKIQDNSNGLICYFELNKKTNIFGKVLNKGEYILKEDKFFKQDKINLLEKLSNLNLIPKILMVRELSTVAYDSIIIIMEFFDGIDLNKLIAERNWQSDNKNDMPLRIKIWNAIEKEYDNWEKYSIRHNDLQTQNILVSMNSGNSGKILVKFIDPLLNPHYYDDEILSGIEYRLLGEQ